MDNHLEILPNWLLEMGYSATNIGLSGIGFDYKCLPSVLKCLSRNNIAILGGDVLYIEYDGLRMNEGAENWYTDILHEEQYSVFIKRSFINTIKYVRQNKYRNVVYIMTVVNEKEFDNLYKVMEK